MDVFRSATDRRATITSLIVRDFKSKSLQLRTFGDMFWRSRQIRCRSGVLQQRPISCGSETRLECGLFRGHANTVEVEKWNGLTPPNGDRRDQVQPLRDIGRELPGILPTKWYSVCVRSG